MKEKKQNGDFILDKNALYQKMTDYMPTIYFPGSFKEDTINELANEEFCRIRGIICREYQFNEEKFILEHDGTSPFDYIRKGIEKEVYTRIRKDENYPRLMNIRNEYIKLIYQAVKETKNIIGTFYQNQGIHFQHDKDAQEYATSPIVVIHNTDYFSYGCYDTGTLYELFINDKGELFCTLNGESGENYDEPIQNVQIEGLSDIVHWLAEQGFIHFASISDTL